MLYIYILGCALGLGVLGWYLTRKVIDLREAYRAIPRSLGEQSILAGAGRTGTAWWDILNIPRQATEGDIERAYEREMSAERRRLLMGGRREIIENGSRIPLIERARSDALAQIATSNSHRGD